MRVEGGDIGGAEGGEDEGGGGVDELAGGGFYGGFVGHGDVDVWTILWDIYLCG